MKELIIQIVSLMLLIVCSVFVEGKIVLLVYGAMIGIVFFRLLETIVDYKKQRGKLKS